MARKQERGDFRFEGLCIEGTHLVLNGEGVAAPEARALEQEPDLSNVLLRAPAQCHLRVILADPARADRLSLLDERERPVSWELHAAHPSVSLPAQRSSPCVPSSRRPSASSSC